LRYVDEQACSGCHCERSILESNSEVGLKAKK
jgi:hypothetical protein